MKRFKVDADGEPNEEVVSSPLMLSTILDPRYKCLISREILSPEKVTLLHGSILKLIGETESGGEHFENQNIETNTTIKQEVSEDCSSLEKKQKVWDF